MGEQTMLWAETWRASWVTSTGSCKEKLRLGRMLQQALSASAEPKNTEGVKMGKWNQDIRLFQAKSMAGLVLLKLVQMSFVDPSSIKTFWCALMMILSHGPK